jgi:hypothetical protein
MRTYYILAMFYYCINTKALLAFLLSKLSLEALLGLIFHLNDNNIFHIFHHL